MVEHLSKPPILEISRYGISSTVKPHSFLRKSFILVKVSSETTTSGEIEKILDCFYQNKKGQLHKEVVLSI